MSTVYVTYVSDVQYLQRRIQNGFHMIHTTPGIFQRARQSLSKRAVCWGTLLGIFFSIFGRACLVNQNSEGLHILYCGIHSLSLGLVLPFSFA
jgi:hypothetical protein